MTDYYRPLPKGVPELPDGHFYRVSESRVYYGELVCDVRRKTWWGSVEVDQDLVRLGRTTQLGLPDETDDAFLARLMRVAHKKYTTALSTHGLEGNYR